MAFLQKIRNFFAGSVRKQLIWGVALIHAVMMTLFVHDLMVRQQEFLIQAQTDEARSLVKTLSLSAITPMLASDLAGLQELASATSRYPDVKHVIIIHKNGKILADGDVDRRGSYIGDMASFTHYTGAAPVILSQSRALVDIVSAVTSNGKQLGWVRIGVAQGDHSNRLEEITQTGILYTLLAIFAGALVAWFMGKGLTRRLTALHDVADTVSTGNLAIRAPVSGADELSHLAKGFNYMLDALARRAKNEAELQAALLTEKELAEVTLASIGDAVIVANAAGEITFMNLVAAHFVGWPPSEAIGHPLSKVFYVTDALTGDTVPSPLHHVLGLSESHLGLSAMLLHCRTGETYEIEESASPIYSPDNQLLGGVLVFRDVTEQRRFQQKLQWQAGHDALTELPNRILLADRLALALEKSKRNQHPLAVCVLDLDGFKPVNDTYGHAVGDKLLIEVAQRLLAELRAGDTLSRLGGDEFVILFEDVLDLQALNTPLDRILETLSSPFTVDGHNVTVSVSIGVTVYPQDLSDADALLRHADQAMYQAKQAGRNQIAWFDVHQDRDQQVVLQVVSKVKKALDRKELTLYYQPKIDMRNGEIIGMEALLRWIHPERGLVPPGEFLPQLEHSNLIVEIGHWVIEEAIKQASIWLSEGKRWKIGINIAAKHIQMPDFIEQLKIRCAPYPQCASRMLEIEILESAALNDVEQTRKLILSVQAEGIDFSLDDFGTGYSSLKYLKRLPVNVLKIDQTFVRDILEDKDDRALVGAVIGLANAFNRGVIAEGVETWEHARLLLQMGCHHGQGYGIARPMPVDQIPAWVEKFKADFPALSGQIISTN